MYLGAETLRKGNLLASGAKHVIGSRIRSAITALPTRRHDRGPHLERGERWA